MPARYNHFRRNFPSKNNLKNTSVVVEDQQRVNQIISDPQLKLACILNIKCGHQIFRLWELLSVRTMPKSYLVFILISRQN